MDDFEAFLRWHTGPLLEKHNRQAYAEWLVQRALRLKPGPYRAAEAVLDVGEPGLTLAVRSAAYLQGGEREPTHAIQFTLEPRHVSAWLFCLLAEQDPERVDPRDVSQWRFWLVPSKTLHAGRRSIGLQVLQRAHGEGVGYDQLPARLQALPVPAAGGAGGGDGDAAQSQPLD